MTRTILAAATAFLAATTLMADQARACISCEYTPEVVRENLTSRSTVKSRVSARTVAASPRAGRPRLARPSQPAAKPTHVARAVVVKAPTAKAKEITTGSVEKPAGPSASDAAAEAKAPASTSTVLMSQETRTAEVQPAKAVGCKKFLPAVGVTVDCK